MTRAKSEPRKTPDAQSLKNRLLAALTDDWQRMREINAVHFPGVAAPHLGHAMLALVSEGLVDRKEIRHKVFYRKGTGRNYTPQNMSGEPLQPAQPTQPAVRPVAPTRSKPLALVSDEEVVSLVPSLESITANGAAGGTVAKSSAPSVIPAGHDYLVFANIAKIRLLGLEKVAVFWCVSDGDVGAGAAGGYNLAVDTYEGQAALDIQEAFEQRLKGWVSTAYIAEVRTKLKNVELERNEALNELKRVKENLRKTRATLRSLTANLNLDDED